MTYFIKNTKIDIVTLAFFTMMLLVVSYSYHTVWLMYDLLSLFSIIYFFKYMQKGIYLFFICILFLYLLILLIPEDNIHLISLLSMFDNYKHIFVFYMVLRAIDIQSIEKSKTQIKLIYKTIELFFYLQLIIVTLQHFLWHLKFDDVAGTFGFHATHALGVFTLLYFILVLYYRKKSYLYKIFVFFCIIYINYLAENKGIYILLTVILIFKFPKYFFILSIVLLPFIFFNEHILHYTLSIISRANEYLSVFTIKFDIPKSSRGELTAYALQLGGLFGAGVGKFSEIYNLTGWGIGELKNPQIAISTASQMLSEIGIIGLILSIFTYLSLFKLFFIQFYTWAFVSFLFVLLIFYNRTLMDERIAIGFLFILVVIKIFSKNPESKSSNKNRIVVDKIYKDIINEKI